MSHRIGDLVSDRPLAGFDSGRFGSSRTVTVAGLVDEVKKRGPRVVMTLDDRTGRSGEAQAPLARAVELVALGEVGGDRALQRRAGDGSE